MRTVERRATAPYCTCRSKGFGFQCVAGRWVTTCCQRITKYRYERGER